MNKVECSDCGSPVWLEGPQSTAVRCLGCTALNRDARAANTLEAIRRQLLAYPMPLAELKRFYRVVVGHEGYADYHTDVLNDRCISRLYALNMTLASTQRSVERVERLVLSVFPDGAIASVQQHRLLSDLARERGLIERAGAELTIAELLTERIGETGDGSEEAPYLVVDVADEHHLLRAQQRSSVGVFTCEDGARYFDVHECDDGSEVWFEVTAQLEAHYRLNIGLAG